MMIIPLTASAGYLEMKDGAKIYYEDHGSGQPIILVPGWTLTTKFWQANVPELAKEFRVITIDPRGAGNSTKILTGHTVKQYAQDIRELIEQLGLRDVTLCGHSLAGAVILSYWQQYSQDSRLKALGIIESDPSAMSPAEWNSHWAKNYNIEGMGKAFNALVADQHKAATAFVYSMVHDPAGVSDDNVEWMASELCKTPPWIGIALATDYLVSDYTKILPTITVPTIVFGGVSKVFSKGIEQGRYIASQIPNATFVPFEDAGHLLFYEKPEQFTKALREFIKGVK
jgi:pimeloyl-ACP methyl ester carboxylesterase